MAFGRRDRARIRQGIANSTGILPVNFGIREFRISGRWRNRVLEYQPFEMRNHTMKIGTQLAVLVACGALAGIAHAGPASPQAPRSPCTACPTPVNPARALLPADPPPAPRWDAQNSDCDKNKTRANVPMPFAPAPLPARSRRAGSGQARRRGHHRRNSRTRAW